MSRRSLLCLTFLALAAGLPATGQTIVVRTLAMRSDPLPEVFVTDGKEHQALRFSAVQPGEPLRALAANPLPLYRSQMDAKGKQAFVVAHQVKLPAGAKGILLLGWTVGDHPRYVAIKDDFASARFNDWLLINAASRPVAFKVGDDAKAMVVTPGTSAGYRVTAAQGQGAAVLAQAPIRGEPKVFFSTYWPVHADKRTVVLFADDGPERILVKRISDKLAPPEPQKPAG